MPVYRALVALRPRPAPPRRAPGLLCAVVVAAALLSGCEAAVVLDVDLDGDGSGRVEVGLEADAAAVAAVDEAVADAEAVADVAVSHPLDAFAATVDDLGGWQLSDIRDGDGGRRVAAAATVEGPDELEAVTADLAAALDGPDGRLLGPVAAAVDDDTVRLDGELAADVDPAAALGWADPLDDLRVDGVPLERLAGGDAPLTVRLQATLPGPVLDSDADEVDGQTLTWHGEPGAVREVHAVGERPLAARHPWLWAAAAGVGVAAVAVAVAAAVRRRGRG